MKRIIIIGPGDIDFHYYQLLGINKKKFQSELEKIAKSLSESGVSISLLPDKGISIEIAKLYKKFNGKEVIGFVPKSDTTFYIEHLKPYIETKINGKSLFDKIIDSGDWYKHDLILGLFGDAVLYLGVSPGTEGELHYSTYLFKLFQKMKAGVDIVSEKVHSEIRAGKNNQFTYFVYTPFIKAKNLEKETEEYLKKFGIKLEYVKNAGELREKIENL